MVKSTGGGIDVKASTLVVGDTIRNPKNREQIFIVEEKGSVIFARGYDSSYRNKHIFLQGDTVITKVTGASTETTEEA